MSIIDTSGVPMYPTRDVLEQVGELAIGLIGGAAVVGLGGVVVIWLVFTIYSYLQSQIMERNRKPIPKPREHE